MVSSSAEAAETLQRLRSDPIRLLGRFGAASNATFLVWTGGEAPPDAASRPEDLDPAHLAVYKPRRGERPLWDFPRGTLHLREVAAWVVSEALGWGLVPPTVLREDGPHGPGSLQRYVPHDPSRHYFWLLEHGEGDVRAQLEAMVLFDLVIDNADRKAGHVLWSQGRVQLVDHGVSLHVEPKLRTVAWEFATRPTPTDRRDDVAALAGRLRAGRDPAPRLGELLSEEEVAALTERAEHVSGLERFPEPSGPHPYPWPLV